MNTEAQKAGKPRTSAPPMKVPVRLITQPTSARDWYVLLFELGDRAVHALRRENVYGWVWR